MKVEQRKVNSLIPYAKNAKKHSDKQIQNVAKVSANMDLYSRL